MKFFLSTLAALALAGSATAASEQRELQVFGYITSVAKDLLAAVNKARADNGVAALCLNVKLTTAAQVQVTDMSNGGFIAATGSDGSSPTSRAEAQKFNTAAGGVAEIVGAGYMNATHAIQEWMSSPAYSQYVLGDYKFLGAAYTWNSKQTYRSFWVLDFSKDAEGEVCA